jgi:hypothetical protein
MKLGRNTLKSEIICEGIRLTDWFVYKWLLPVKLPRMDMKYIVSKYFVQPRTIASDLCCKGWFVMERYGIAEDKFAKNGSEFTTKAVRECLY